MAVVTFDYAAWVMRYPEFSGSVQPGLAQAYFDEATGILDNTDSSNVTDTTVRLRLLNMLTAHIAALSGCNASPLVGRIASASEGSVSVTAEYNGDNRAAWFNQTKYGAAYWQAMRGLWQGPRYVPGFQPIFDPIGRMRRGGWQ